VALPPTVPRDYPVTDTPRYRQIADRFGLLAHEQGISGCHVHVAVPDRDTAVRVCTWLRSWLPLFVALTANSAIHRESDSGYASWRSVLWQRWPSAGPPPHLDSAAEYDALVTRLEESGAMLDDGMVYWDARPSAKFPTVEIRAADVPATADETVLLATLARACVMTATAALARGESAPNVPEPVLRAAYWRCARDGLEGRSAAMLAAFVDELRPALEQAGDFDYAQTELKRISQDGNGAMRQRRDWRRRGDIRDVVQGAAQATLA
jgi:glutamate---cysteine ligase / carboxylate-amine ligase